MQKLTIEEHVSKIQTYFKQKTLAQDFKVTKVAENFINILIDEKYDLSIWIGEEARHCEFWQTYHAQAPNYLVPQLDEYEREELHQICLKIREENQVAIAQKEIDDLLAKKAQLEAKIANLNTKNN
jgi:hypothetical protein